MTEMWTSPGKVVNPKPDFDVRSYASGLIPPRWLWRPLTWSNHSKKRRQWVDCSLLLKRLERLQ